MRGHKTTVPSDPTAPARDLLAAILTRAIEDARAGDTEAARWLAEDAPPWAELLGIDPAVLACWPCSGPGRHIHTVRRERPPKERTEAQRARERQRWQAKQERKRQAKEAKGMGTTIKQTRFEALPTGSYPAVIGAVELAEGQFGQQVKIRFDLTGDLSGRSIMGWASANFSPKSKLYGWVRAAVFGGTEVPPDYDLDLDHLLDRPVMVTLIEREGDDGQTFNKIDGVKSTRSNGGAQPRPPAAGSATLAQRRQVTAAAVRSGTYSAQRGPASAPGEPPDWPDWPDPKEPPF